MMAENRRLRILIVEDNPSYLEMYEELLAPDHDLTLARTKEEAKEQVYRESFDIALLDMRLVSNQRGNTDGLEIAQLMRDLGYGTIIILKSGFPTESSAIAERLKELGVLATLDKSANNAVEELMDRIAEASAQIRRNLQ